MENFFELLKKDHNKVKGIMKKLKDSSGKEERVDLLNKLKMEIEPHMEAEENVFYTVLTTKKEAKEKALEAIEEHHVANTVLRELDKNSKEGDRWKAKMSVFKELVEHHIEEEEGEIFEVTEKVLSEDQMSDMLKRFTDAKQKAKSKMQ
jgi:hemerythrin-like domain-containing protein